MMGMSIEDKKNVNDWRWDQSHILEKGMSTASSLNFVQVRD